MNDKHMEKCSKPLQIEPRMKHHYTLTKWICRFTLNNAGVKHTNPQDSQKPLYNLSQPSQLWI